MQDRPRAKTIAGPGYRLRWQVGADEAGDGAIIRRVGKYGVEENSFWPEEFHQRFAAADVMNVAVRQDQMRKAVDSLGVKIRDGDHFQRGVVPAIDEPVCR